MTIRPYYWIVLLVAGSLLICVGILGVAARDGARSIIWFAFGAIFLGGAYYLKKVRPSEPPVEDSQGRSRGTVAVNLGTSESAELQKWLRSTPLETLPSAHPAVAVALAHLEAALTTPDLQLWDQDAIVLYDWLRDDGFAGARDGLPAGFLDALEGNTTLRLITTRDSVEAARESVVRGDS